MKHILPETLRTIKFLYLMEQTNSSISSLLDIRMKKVLLKQHITNDTISVQTLKVIFVNG